MLLRWRRAYPGIGANPSAEKSGFYSAFSRMAVRVMLWHGNKIKAEQKSGSGGSMHHK
jgi:hypothetical protein